MLVWKQIGKVTTLIKWECGSSNLPTSTWVSWLHDGSIPSTSTLRRSDSFSDKASKIEQSLRPNTLLRDFSVNLEKPTILYWISPLG